MSTAIAVHQVNAAKLPQAVDDDYIFGSEADGGQYALDVLANDKGGNAKTIVDVQGLPDGVTWESAADGTLLLNIGDLSPDEVADFTFTYTIQLGNGALSEASVHFQASSVDNLIDNGSFEGASPPSGQFAFMVEPDWTGTATPGGAVEVWNAHNGVTATDGHNLVELDAAGAIDSITQQVDTTDSREYLLTFDYAARGNSPGVGSSDFQVLWDGGVIETVVATDTGWTQFSAVVTGDGDDSIGFTELVSQNNGYGVLIDNVSLVPII